MNIKDIAKLAGVSVSTVSKVMNQKDNSISQETREKVLKIAKEYNYAPYSSFIPATSKSFLIGVLFRSAKMIQNTLSGILSAARSHGYQVILAESDGSPEEELKSVTGFCKNKVDAVLWEPTSGKNPEAAAELKKAQIPYLLFNSPSASSENIDYRAFGYQATQELIRCHHQGIACLLLSGRRTEAFFEGYKKCLFDHQIPLREELVFDEHNLQGLLHKISSHTVTAVVCSHYASATELYAHSLAQHYQIPWDFSLISLRDDIRPKDSFPEISAFSVSHYDYGKFLCKKILHILENIPLEQEHFQAEYLLSSRATLDIPSFLRSKKILVVGSTNLDIYLKVPQLPASGRAVLTSQSSLYAGGKATNEAIGVSKLGHRAAILSAVGDHSESDIIYEALRQYSVNTDGMKRVMGASTGKAYIFVEPKGESMITILSGANNSLSPEDLSAKEHLFKNTAYALINTEIPMETAETACRLTRKHGGKTILKPSSCNRLSPELLRTVDILILNLTELFELCSEGASMEEKAALLYQYGVDIVIVTLGAKGCYVLSAEISEHFPAKNFPSIDNTGAGDAFISAFASYLIYGYSLRQAVHIASYAAGFCISREGVVPSLVDKDTLEAYIYQHEPDLLKRNGQAMPSPRMDRSELPPS